MTVIEVTAKKAELEAKIIAELAEAKKAKPTTDEFNVHYDAYRKAQSELAKIDDTMAKAQADEANQAILADCATIAAAIDKLVLGLEIAKKLGVPVKTLRYIVEDDGKSNVKINSITKVASKGSGEGKAPSAGHTKITAPDGTDYSLTKFVKKFATAAELATDAYKYPHTKVDSLPKFNEFCTGHKLEGYVYVVPAATDEAAS